MKTLSLTPILLAARLPAASLILALSLPLAASLHAQPVPSATPSPPDPPPESVTVAVDPTAATDATAPAEAVPAELEAADWRTPEEEPEIDRVRIPELLCIGSDGQVARTEETSQMVVVFGNGTVEGRVRYDVVTVFGAIKVDGEVGGDLVAPFSRVELGPRARIRGDLVVIGGSLQIDPAARLDGQRVDMSWERLERLPGVPAIRKMLTGFSHWFSEGLLLGRLLPASWGWWWWVATAMGLLYLLITLVAPRAVAAGAAELEAQPVVCFFVGILGYLLVNIVLVILGATGIGVLAWPFVLIALLVVQSAGKASLYQAIGVRLGRQTGSQALTQPLPALLAGLVLFTLIFMIPLLGILTWLVVAPLGLGAALMAMFAQKRPPTPAPSSATPSPELALSMDAPPESWAVEPTTPAPMPGPPPVIGSTTPHARAAAELASLPRAGFWIRTAATLLDLLVVLVPLALVGLPDYFLAPWIAYHVAFWTWKGTTVGGVVCRLKVVRTDGQPLNFPVALVRSLASFLSAAAVFIGFFWVGWTRERLSWHDRIAGTAIVKAPPGINLL